MAEKDLRTLVRKRVSELYWKNDKNCATTVLCILAEIFRVELFDQTIDAALAMHGVGKYGAQCGLVEGAIMFMGILGRRNKVQDTVTIDVCREFARQFENRFGSLLCVVLRPEGFADDNPPHLCENITCEAIEFTANYVSQFHYLEIA